MSDQNSDSKPVTGRSSADAAVELVGITIGVLGKGAPFVIIPIALLFAYQYGESKQQENIQKAADRVTAMYAELGDYSRGQLDSAKQASELSKAVLESVKAQTEEMNQRAEESLQKIAEEQKAAQDAWEREEQERKNKVDLRRMAAELLRTGSNADVEILEIASSHYKPEDANAKKALDDFAKRPGAHRNKVASEIAGLQHAQFERLREQLSFSHWYSDADDQQPYYVGLGRAVPAGFDGLLFLPFGQGDDAAIVSTHTVTLTGVRLVKLPATDDVARTMYVILSSGGQYMELASTHNVVPVEPGLTLTGVVARIAPISAPQLLDGEDKSVDAVTAAQAMKELGIDAAELMWMEGLEWFQHAAQVQSQLSATREARKERLDWIGSTLQMHAPDGSEISDERARASVVSVIHALLDGVKNAKPGTSGVLVAALLHSGFEGGSVTTADSGDLRFEVIYNDGMGSRMQVSALVKPDGTATDVTSDWVME
jgi:hypothetical protein